MLLEIVAVIALWMLDALIVAGAFVGVAVVVTIVMLPLRLFLWFVEHVRKRPAGTTGLRSSLARRRRY